MAKEKAEEQQVFSDKLAIIEEICDEMHLSLNKMQKETDMGSEVDVFAIQQREDIKDIQKIVVELSEVLSDFLKGLSIIFYREEDGQKMVIN